LPLPQPATDLQPIACHPLDATVAIWQIPTALNKPQPKEMTNSSAQQRQDADRAKGFGVWHGIGAGDGIWYMGHGRREIRSDPDSGVGIESRRGRGSPSPHVVHVRRQVASILAAIWCACKVLNNLLRNISRYTMSAILVHRTNTSVVKLGNS